MASSCLADIFSSSSPGVLGFWFCLLQTMSKNWLFLLSISADGKESPLPFWGPSQSFGFSLLPLGVRRPIWRLATVHSNGRIVLILFLSSQWDTTWQYLPNDNKNHTKSASSYLWYDIHLPNPSTQGQFNALLFSFSVPRLVAITALTSLVYPTIYP